MLRILLRIVADAVVVAIALFAAAGTLAWPRAWAVVVVLLAVRALSAIAVFRVNPALLRERATVLVHHEQPWVDRILLLVFMATAFIGVPIVAALDVFRWHLFPSPPPWLATLGLVLFVLGWIIKALALRENAFAVTVVRLQSEREHAVVDTGVYSVVRHPMYAGSPLALLMVRIALEERFLRRELPGYPDYMRRVPHRLVPGIW